MIGISQLTRIWTAQEPRPYKLGQIVDKVEGVDGVFEFIKYHHGQNSIRGIAGLPVFARQDATSTDDIDTDADTTLYDVSADFNGNTTSRRPRGILVGKRPLGFPGGGGVYQNLQFGFIQRSGKPIVDLWTDGNVVQGDRLYANRNPFMLDGSTAINVSHLIGSTRSVAVASAAATLGAPIGYLTDASDINADTSVSPWCTLTNGHIVATSVVSIIPHFTPTTNAIFAAQVTPGAGSAVITIRNVSAAANNTANMTWGFVVHDALDNHFGKALQDDETNEILVLFPAGRTPDGTAALASYVVDETVTWGSITGKVKEVFDSYAGSTRTQWGMRLDTVTGTPTGTATGGTSGATSANTAHTVLYKLKAQNVILDIAA